VEKTLIPDHDSVATTDGDNAAAPLVAHVIRLR
jgi:hypothetical protein